MTTRAGGSRRPNIVLVMADDLGYECLGCYGSQSYATPNLDRLARQGMRFTNAHAQPLCTPTRVQLMTGKYNFRNWQAFGVMHPQERTFGHIMSAAGYRTCISGKWQLYSYNPPEYEPEWRGKGQHPKDAGFHEYFLWHAEHTEDKGSRYADPKILDNGKYLQPPETSGKHGADLFAAYINEFIYRNRDRPFFVYYPMALTHAPFQPTPHTRGWPDNRHDTDPKYFKDMVEYHDEVIGRIMRQIDDLRLGEDTLFIYYSDNGSPREVWTRVNGRDMRGGKSVNSDAGTHVPLIARWRGRIEPGSTCDDLIDSSDFFPTIMEAAGVHPPGEHVVDGRSFMPQLTGRRGSPREWVFFHHDPLPGADKVGRHRERFVRDKRWVVFEDGRMFDLSQDILQERPILPGEEPTSEARAARKRLQDIFYEMRPPDRSV